jgi:coenzyme F420-dependent glucose-6-phosphate dehydrogenase
VPGLIGFHCSHEQHPPSALLDLVIRAERAGFRAAMCSDHFFPWSVRQNQSGFAWSWLGAALARTGLSFGTVCAPGQRYHPAVIAQAAATLAEMFPERFWLSVGSGEALNEAITGDPWPDKHARNDRLKECVDIMRALWDGQTVTHDGRVRVRQARLYTRPIHPPLVVAAALTPQTAQWAGSWADALITVSSDRDHLRRMMDAFRSGGGEGKPVWLQAVVSFGATDHESALAAHDQWRQAALDPTALTDLPAVEAFDEAARAVTVEQVARRVRVSADPARHVEWLRGDFEMGFDRVYVHNVLRDHDRFFDVWSEKVLPDLSRI